jgi:hypothetical protein
MIMGIDGCEFDYLSPRYTAQDIVMHSNVAWFVAPHDREAAKYHWDAVHRNFQRLADTLGYKVERKI